MPHDVDGRPVKLGDRVLVPCRVTLVTGGEEYCNVTLVTEVPMQPSGHPVTISLNAAQVRLAPEDPPTGPGADEG